MDFKSQISLEEFQKVDLRVGKILEVEELSGKSSLYKLHITLGNETRDIVAGIKDAYDDKDQLVGKNIIVVANLTPKHVAGVSSKGMLLAADVGGRPILIIPDKEVPAGSIIR